MCDLRSGSLIVGAVLLLLPQTGRAQDAWAPGVYMTQAIDEMLLAVRVLTDGAQLGYVDEGVCMAGAFLHVGTTYSLDRSFQGGTEYVLIAGGDEDATDVDLEVLNQAGRRIVGDNSYSRMALVRFNPQAAGDVTIRMRLFDARRAAFCAFAVLQRGGVDVPAVNLITAKTGFLTQCASVVLTTRAFGVATEFLARPNQAAVIGRVPPSGEAVTLQNVDLGGAPTVVVAAGDTQARDLDLYLLNRGGAELVKDIDPDALPMVAYTPTEGESYAIKLANQSGNGRKAFVLSGVLQMGR